MSSISTPSLNTSTLRVSEHRLRSFHMQVLVNDHDALKCARVVVSKYGVDKAIPQFYIKWITKLSFALKITQFLVCEHYYFISPNEESEFTKS